VAESTHKKLDLALELLNEAIRQFLDRKSFVCALSLAGAAEEILGKTVELRGGQSSLAQRVKDHLMIANAFGSSKLTEKQSKWRHNFAKNAIKHLDGANDEEITLDLEDEAIDMLGRATHNVILLQLPYTEELRRFDDWYMENCVGV
jgi:hypothetical protein